MIRYLLLIIALITSAGCIDRTWSANEPDYSRKYDSSRDAFADLDAARDKAKNENKNILIIVGGEWCRWCHALDKYFSDNHEVQGALLSHYVVLKIGIDQNGPVTPLLETLPDFNATPHFFVMSPSGRLIKSMSTSSLETNDSYDQLKFIQFLNQYRS